MTDSGAKKDRLTFEAVKSNAKFFGIASAVLLLIALLIPVKAVNFFALFGLTICGCRFLFEFATVISMSIEGKARNRFQFAIAAVVPSLLSLYFIRDVSPITLRGVLGYMFSAWFLLPFGAIAYFSWAAADYLNKEHPFRGFLIASAVIFVICFMGHHENYLETDDHTERNTVIIDKELAKGSATTGGYFGQFIVYIIISYSAMLIKLRNRDFFKKREKTSLAKKAARILKGPSLIEKIGVVFVITLIFAWFISILFLCVFAILAN